MDVNTLSQQPLFTISLVISCLVAAYGISSIFRGLLTGVSKRALAIDSSSLELTSIDLAGELQRQLDLLSDRIARLNKLAPSFPRAFTDRAWGQIQALLNDLNKAQGELHRLLNEGDLNGGIRLAATLTGCELRSILPGGMNARESSLPPSVFNWQQRVSELMQRLISRIEDQIREDNVWKTPEQAIDITAELVELKRDITTSQG
jgi:hypothetical protein